MPQFYEPDYAINSRVYDIAAEGELANVLSHYSYDFIYDTIETNIRMVANRNVNVLNMPNFVGAIEQDMAYIKARYHSEEEVNGTRQEVYRTIIDILCREYHLIFNDVPGLDYYSVAFVLYDFLVANFNNYMTSFFTTYIYNESNSLYEALNLSAAKKNKDTSSIYAKKLYEDPKLATIASNLMTILYSMSAYDIPFEAIIRTVLISTGADILYVAVTPEGDFFKEVYCKCLLDEMNLPIAITSIRLEMQKRYRYVVPEYPVPAPNTEEDPNNGSEEISDNT